MGDLSGLVEENPYLRGYMQGYLSELKFQRKALLVPGVTSVDKLEDSGPERGDFAIGFKGSRLIIEVKSVSSRGVKEDLLNGGWWGTVLNKRTSTKSQLVAGSEDSPTPPSTHVLAGSFDGLAVCTYSVDGLWDFVYFKEAHLPRVDGNPGLLRTSMQINPLNTPLLQDNLETFLEDLHASRVKISP
jgi:hypothetical protein